MARTMYMGGRMYGKHEHLYPPVLKHLNLRWDSNEQRYVQIESETKSDEEDIE